MSDLTIRDLTIEYSSGGYAVRPIDGMNLEVGDGELVLLLGASGCGKTTLLSALATLLTPKSGSIHLGDTDVTALSGADLAHYRRETCGVVFQAFNLIPSLTARENIEVPMWAAGIRGKAARARAEALLEQVDLGHRGSHKPDEMSGGQQQRVAIARALAHDPSIVLADVPPAHLDFIQVEGVLRLLRDLAAAGRVVVIATHDERLLALADRVVELTPHAAPDSLPTEQWTLAAGEQLFAQGDAGDRVFVVDSGRIDLVRVLEDGTEQIIAMAPAGKYFGELAPMFGLPRSATARAAEPTVLTGYGLREFRGWLGEHGQGGPIPVAALDG